MFREKFYKKIISIILALNIVVLTSCTNSIITQAPEIDPYDLAYEVILASDRFDLVKLKSSGYMFFECPDDKRSEYDKAFDLCLNDMQGENLDTDSLSRVYDMALLFYQISLLYDKEGAVIDDFSSLRNRFVELNFLYRQPIEDVYVFFSSIINSGDFNNQHLMVFLDFLNFSIPCLDSETLIVIEPFLQIMYAKYKDESLADKYIDLSKNLSCDYGYDKDLAKSIYSQIQPRTDSFTTKKIDDITNYLCKKDFPINVIDTVEFFGVNPTYFVENGTFYYTLDGYEVVFYGVPSTTVQIVNVKNGAVQSWFSRNQSGDGSMIDPENN